MTRKLASAPRVNDSLSRDLLALVYTMTKAHPFAVLFIVLWSISVVVAGITVVTAAVKVLLS